MPRPAAKSSRAPTNDRLAPHRQPGDNHRRSFAWRFTCLVADGYAYGQAIADLVHQQVVTPSQAPRQVVLSGRLVVR